LGKEALVLIKSSFVLLSPDEKLRISARNRLCGTVRETIPARSIAKSSWNCPAGGCSPPSLPRKRLNELGFVPGQRACALIKASHVILAVND
jgi:molybdate transport system regulatory protein